MKPWKAVFDKAINKGILAKNELASALPDILEDDLEMQLLARAELMRLGGLIKTERQVLEQTIAERLLEGSGRAETTSFTVEAKRKSKKRWDTKAYVDILIDRLGIDPKNVFDTLQRWEPGVTKLKCLLKAEGKDDYYSSVVDCCCIVEEQEGASLIVKLKEGDPNGS